MTKSPRDQQRSFGRSVGVVLLLVGVYGLVRGRPSGPWFLVIGALLASLGTFAPSVLRVPSAIWWTVSRALGWVNARILLGAVFFLILTPTGFVLRLFGYDPLQTKPTPSGSTWLPYPPHTNDPKHYERLF